MIKRQRDELDLRINFRVIQKTQTHTKRWRYIIVFLYKEENCFVIQEIFVFTMHMSGRCLLLCLLNLKIKIFSSTKFYESVGKRFTPTTGSSIKQVNLKTRSHDCLVECFQHNLCKSFNVFKDDNTGKLLCDMYDTTIGSVTNNRKFTYFFEEKERVIPQSSVSATTEISEKTCKGNIVTQIICGLSNLLT